MQKYAVNYESLAVKRESSEIKRESCAIKWNHHTSPSPVKRESSSEKHRFSDGRSVRGQKQIGVFRE